MDNPLDFIAKAIGAIGSSITTSVLMFIFIIAMIILGFGLIMKILNIQPSQVAQVIPQARALRAARAVTGY